MMRILRWSKGDAGVATGVEMGTVFEIGVVRDPKAWIVRRSSRMVGAMDSGWGRLGEDGGLWHVC